MENPPLFFPEIADGEDKSSPLANRLRNTYRHLRKWAKRTSTNCFRIYERDIASYPLAIDFYDGRFCIQYFSKTRESDHPSQQLVEEVQEALRTVFGVSPDLIFWRTRAKHHETRQYEKQSDAQEFFAVIEYGVKFRVNLTDYLDTGLFLDHRETRQLVAAASQGKRLLNLFAYTCSFSVQAAAAGATFTKSVDMSNTYTAWGKENFRENSFSLQNHVVVRADCLKFLDEEIRANERYDVIVIDPPTISRSKKMDQLFDIQIDYISLISKALQLLSKEGVIFFSTNSRKFVFDLELLGLDSGSGSGSGSGSEVEVVEISHLTLPVDFKDPKIHRCWKIKRNAK